MNNLMHPQISAFAMMMVSFIISFILIQLLNINSLSLELIIVVIIWASCMALWFCVLMRMAGNE